MPKLNKTIIDRITPGPKDKLVCHLHRGFSLLGEPRGAWTAGVPQ